MEVIPQKTSQNFKTTRKGVVLGDNGKRLGDHTETQDEGLRETTTIGTRKDSSGWNKIFASRIIRGNLYNFLLIYQSPRMLDKTRPAQQ